MGLARSISSSARIPELVASLLIARGIQTPDTVKAFLNTNFKDHFRKPNHLPGCDAVARFLYQSAKNGKKIVVFGDYDVDGMTSAVILCKTLKDLGARDVRYYIPNRLDEGYGLNAEAIANLKHDACDVIVTVDCGIACSAEARKAKELGIELLITDHHIPEAVLPDAVAIAHPQLVRYPADGNLVSAASLSEEQLVKAKRYPFPLLCGAGVALKIALRLGDLAVQDSKEPFSAGRVREIIVLATLATIADFVPLLDENRALVRTGLEILNAGPVSPGIDALLDVSKNKPDKKAIDSEFIAFQVAPRLNAAGRLGLAGLAVELLWSENRRRCRELADEIDKLNKSRKTMESKMQSEAEKQIREKYDPNNPAFVLDSLDWHRGVLGIVASRIAEHYHRPTILLARSKSTSSAVGSGRGMSGGNTFNLYGALKSCEHLLVRYGGHDAAAGLTIEAQNIETFRTTFCEYAAQNISEEDRTAELFLDGEFPLGAFTRGAVEQISLLAPFGSENAKPIFAAHGVSAENVRPMGKDEKHFQAEFRQGEVSFRGIAFGRSQWVEKLRSLSEPIDIAFKVGVNYGKIELDILDWRPAQ